MKNGPSEYFYHRPYLLWLILAVNFLSSLYGYYWYRWQLAATPYYLWPFTPDCPLAATLMAVALGIYLFTGRRETWFQFLTYTVLLKYGFWTVFVFILFWAAGGDARFDYLMLFISHVGMLLEGAIFISGMPQSPRFWWMAGGWSLLNDMFDYFYPIRISGRAALGVHPYLPDPGQLPIIRSMTFAVTACFILAALITTLRRRRLPGP